MIEHFTLELVDSYMLAPQVRHMAFVRTDGQALLFTPGQFIQLHFTDENGAAVKRSYSIATPRPAQALGTEIVELTVSYVHEGLASKVLAHLEHGQKINASGAYGRFCLMDSDANQRYLLLATGTGIAAYRAMRLKLIELVRQRQCRIDLLQGMRNEQEWLYGDEFSELAHNEPGFNYYPCFSRELPALAHDNMHQGYVQSLLPTLTPSPDTDIAYLCGNPDMVDQGFAALKTYGMRLRYIRREKYTASR